MFSKHYLFMDRMNDRNECSLFCIYLYRRLNEDLAQIMLVAKRQFIVPAKHIVVFMQLMHIQVFILNMIEDRKKEPNLINISHGHFQNLVSYCKTHRNHNLISIAQCYFNESFVWFFMLLLFSFTNHSNTFNIQIQ